MNSWKIGLVVLAAMGVAACSSGGGSPAPTAGGEAGMTGEGDVVAQVLASVDTVQLGDVVWGSRNPRLPAQRVAADCADTACTVGHPLIGSDTITFEDGIGIFGDSTAVERVAEKGGVAIMRTTPSETELLGQDVSITAYGAWLDNSYFATAQSDFAVLGQPGIATGPVSFGVSTGTAPSGPATWRGAMVGTDVAPGATFGNRVAGAASMTIEAMENPTLNVAFTEIVDIETNASRDDLRWNGLSVSETGTFRSGSVGDTIEGTFYGPAHAEVGGVFERDSISGAFGAARQ